MKGELKRIKKKYGEELAHFCRDNFSSILETEGKLSEILYSLFEPTTRLYDDLCNNDLLDDFVDLIYQQLDPPKEEKCTDKSPFVLMREAGYTLYECLSENDIKQFKKFYYPGEELCTFKTHRLDKCYVFFAIKDGAEKLKREDIIIPNRQDEYGTSVISIQFTKTNANMVSIKNRYNHSVNNPDATFSNNLDNIIPGLRYSFNHSYGFNIPHFAHNLELPGYILASDGRYYHFNYEVDGIYYCSNNVIIENYEPKHFDSSKYLLFDTYLIDLENKKIVSEYSTKGLQSALGNIEKIDIVKEGEYKIVSITTDHGNVEFVIDLDNMLLEYHDDNIEILPNDFLLYNESLEYISVLNVKGIGDNVLRHNLVLESLELPHCLSIGSNFLKQNLLLENISLPEVRRVGKNFLAKNPQIQKGYFPLLTDAGSGFLDYLFDKTRLLIPNLPSSQILPTEDEYELILMKK
jgi:hypothetical protein